MPDAVMTDRPVTVQRDGPVTTVVLSRPERRNPLSHETMTELTARLREAGDDATVRAVVLGAEGPVFCAGHDLRELSTRDEAVHERVFAACAELMLAIHRLRQPVVARVQGLATAAGCQLVAACDLAVAAESASFATPGVKIGLFCTTPMVEVARAVGRPRAMEMLLTGEPIDARSALQWGLVNRVVPLEQLHGEAAALAARIASASGETLAIGKRAAHENLDLPLDEAYRHASAVMCRNAVTDDAQEGIAAFLDRRPPHWSR
ncbi:MAG TPA: enoyl-CoA hydratase [Miltoncostaeaceae bacterium]|nr:enoyl-CoA hydratase [Miltoncostaeaceae bacterium]